MIIQILLFLFTIASTYFVGGPYYSLSIIAILLAHEMGHYIMSKRYGIPATLPYFLPFPLSPFGTFGAIIKMRGIIMDKKALFDIGIAGPLSGFIISLPFTIVGVSLSKIQSITGDMPYLQLGDPLLFKIAEKLLIGDIPPGHDLVLHPMGYAGWVGLFVTALNLLPVGQLDGGHIAYAVFGDKSKIFSGIVIVLLAILSVFYNPGWVALLIILLIFGVRHPRPLDLDTRLDRKRYVLAYVILVVFLLSFTPAPFPSVKTERGGIPI